MRTKLLRGKDLSTMIVFYPATRAEYGRARETIERRSVAGGRGGRGAGLEVDGRVYRGGLWSPRRRSARGGACRT